MTAGTETRTSTTSSWRTARSCQKSANSMICCDFKVRIYFWIQIYLSFVQRRLESKEVWAETKVDISMKSVQLCRWRLNCHQYNTANSSNLEQNEETHSFCTFSKHFNNIVTPDCYPNYGRGEWKLMHFYCFPVTIISLKLMSDHHWPEPCQDVRH